MRYLSLFSGIEAATVAWKSLGWKAVAFAEFEDFPKAVLAHHYPNVPDLGDVTKITREQIRALGHIDVVVGGSPCQDLSVAGKRAGLRKSPSDIIGEFEIIDDSEGDLTRSGLLVHQIRIFEIAKEECGARFMVWENVPGAFSSNGGDDFAYVLGSMVGRSVHTPSDGWKNSGICLSEDGGRIAEWRVLDAQYFGVPQRRRRIFIVLDTGAWWSRQPFLFEQDGLCWDPAQSGDEGESAAEGVEGSVGECCAIDCRNHRVTPISGTLQSKPNGGQSLNYVNPICYESRTYAAMTGQTGSNGLGICEEKAYTLNLANNQAVIYENHAQDSRVTESVGVCPTLHSQMGTGGGNVPFVLTPLLK